MSEIGPGLCKIVAYSPFQEPRPQHLDVPPCRQSPPQGHFDIMH